MRLPLLNVGLLTSVLVSPLLALEVQWDQDDSIKEAAATAAFDMVSWYSGNNTGDTPGNPPDPYSWYLCGVMFNTILDYWRWTGDDSYNQITYQGMFHQIGEDKNYQPSNQSTSTANDDQGFWAMTAMTAAEYNFQNPPDDQPGWLTLVQTVYNEYVDRWDDKKCGGGLEWQINPWAPGAHYKNSISNGCFFNVATRLYRYTQNDDYKKWAEKIWDWMEEIGFIGMEDDGLAVFDGAGDGSLGEGECTPPAGDFWTYNSGIFMHGAAIMAAETNDTKWTDRVSKLMDFAEARFFRNDVMYEQKCEDETVSKCTNDQTSFKGTLVRFMSYTALLLPDMFDRLTALIDKSARKAAAQCTGTDPDGRGHPDTVCSSSWLHNGWDGISGMNEEMNAVTVLASTLITKDTQKTVTHDTGGTSQGDTNAGKGTGKFDPLANLPPITTADKAGAGILTALALGGLLAGIYWLVT